MGQLADVSPRRGLPRGRARLEPAEVARAQRDVMLRAMTAAVAELGYASVRVGDVVERARVSRQSFYAQFADKQECFLVAHATGIELILTRLAEVAARAAGSSPREQLRLGVRTYLGLAAEEPEFARCMLVELQAIGDAGLQARLASHQQIASVMRSWHAAARAGRRDWPEVAPHRYAAAVGSVHDLVFTLIAEGRASDVPSLESDVLDAIEALLEIPAGSD